MLQNLVSKTSLAISKISSQKIPKTIDPRYTEAKTTFKKISFDVSKMINSLNQMQLNLQKLATASLKFGEDIDHWFSDAPEDAQLKAKTTLSFSKHFSALTINFLSPKVEPNVIALLVRYQNEMNRLNDVKIQRKLARIEYDKSRAALESFLADPSKIDPSKLEEAKLKVSKDKDLYSPLNEDFITSVKKLEDNRESSFEKPYKNLLCLTSQYMMQVFTELQKFRTTFPPNLFVHNEAK
ncbi:hypothetical protein TRFO_02523 [Tritrichomonas foetus]|uniref:BAR domain-containing protein n=1 Tax=Tritrichomonas foetus TaxID=1144522 RepID=A0A1J4L6C0_9EUKA|nr:hypothetical protein TRFO_02523 [Tritrichomonas foetus]|eukprot:OHT17494.1 hypothetical protein TRFO_02523 [Tritrichomonas foetus]